MLLKTLQMLKALSPAERAMIESGHFAGDFTAEALLDQMRTLARFDARNDATRERILTLAVISSLLVVASFVLTIILFVKTNQTYGIAGLVLFLVCLAATSTCFKLVRRMQAVDINNNFRLVALPFLAVLRQDMEREGIITVRVDLRSATHDDKLKDNKTLARPGYLGVVETTYRDAWFDGCARLADGSMLRWNVVDEIRESKRSKRSASGKTKVKTRNLKRSTVAVSLALPNKAYSVIADATSARHKVTFSEGAKRRTIKMVRKIKSKSLDPIDPRALIDAVASAYKRVAGHPSGLPSAKSTIRVPNWKLENR